MHRIDAPGFAPGNLWTEGVPSSSIPATTVGAEFQNDLQEEIVNTILGVGITLVKGTQTQLRDAIALMVASGGGLGSGIQQTVLNNQATPENIVGLLFPSATTKGGSAEIDIERQTDTQNVIEHGTLTVSRDPVANDWRIALSSQFDDTGLTFSVSVGGQVKYISTDLTGPSYSGTMRITHIHTTLNTVI